jgi:hypothetical protein
MAVITAVVMAVITAVIMAVVTAVVPMIVTLSATHDGSIVIDAQSGLIPGRWVAAEGAAVSLRCHVKTSYNCALERVFIFKQKYKGKKHRSRHYHSAMPTDTVALAVTRFVVRRDSWACGLYAIKPSVW